MKIYGIIGYPIKHTLSPAMHEAAFNKLGIDATYKAFEVEPKDLENFLQGNIMVTDIEGQSFHSKDVIGFNVTIPHKVRIFELLIEDKTIQKDQQVCITGAVNTVKRDNDKLIYRNTDVTGFIKSLQQDLKFDTTGKSVLIFGCGGAGRAVVAGLIQKGMEVKKIYLYDVNNEAVEFTKKHFSHYSSYFENMDRLEFISTDQIAEKIKDCNLLVNASPVGMKEGDGSIVDKSLLHKNLDVYDVVYNRETQLIKDAKSRELQHRTNGLGMLLYQGAEAFEIWTGKKAPVEVMRKALENSL